MSKIKMTLDVVEGLRALADSIQALADAVMEGESEKLTDVPAVEEVPQEQEAEKPATKKAAARKTAKPVSASQAEAEKPLNKVPTMEEVRAVLAEKSRAGHTAEVRGLLEKYGAAKLSDVEPGNYPDLLREAEAL